MTQAARRGRNATAEHGQRVTSLELFFDLVFVFAITQVTGFLADNQTALGLLRGLMLLAALWWAWAAYAWLTNSLNPEEGGVRLAMFASMAAMLIVSLAVPYGFDTAALPFAIAYLIVRMLHLALYALGGKRDPELLGAVFRLLPTAVIGPILLLIAAFFDDGPELALWGAALAIDYLGALFGRGRGWRVSPEHFVERHGLIVMIALGESIVAIGVGAADVPLDAGAVTAALLGMVVITALWWSYFDWVVYVAQARLVEASGQQRATLARDLFSYLHLPMVGGIVLFALGLKSTLGHAANPLGTISAIGLIGGLALYFAAHVATRLRLAGGWGRGRPVATLALIGLLPVVLIVPALAALALTAAVCTALIAYEAIYHRYERAWIRRRHGDFTMREATRVSRLRGRGRRSAT